MKANCTGFWIIFVTDMLYRLILKCRHRAFDSKRRKSAEAESKTICVGNISVGGTGKTPHTEMLLRVLNGICPEKRLAVLSRGYKRKSKGYLEISAGTSAALSGDEPLQIKKNCPFASVAVDRNRVEGCHKLFESVKPDVIILDDAFQYRKLKAGLNIVLTDWNRPVHKDRLLPFGRLRDLPERLSAADIIIVSKCPYELEQEEKDAFIAEMKPLLAGKDIPVYFTRMEYLPFEPVFPEGNIRYMYSEQTIFFSGIANDLPARQHLSSDHRIVENFRFADHHDYSSADIRKICAAMKRHPYAGVVTTQKDAQRILSVKKVPDELKTRLFTQPIRAEFCTDAEKEAFVAFLHNFCIFADRT